MAEVTLTNFGEWLVNAGLTGPKLHERGEGWSVWNAQSYQDGLITARWYVFANSSCSWAELERAGVAARTAGVGSYTVVFPNPKSGQLDPQNRSRLDSLIPNGNAISLQRLYYSAAVNRNLRASEAFGIENFVEQRVSFPGLNGPQPALTLLVQWLRGEIRTKQKVIVLLAPGGLHVVNSMRLHYSMNVFSPQHLNSRTAEVRGC
jgi:hypothetical protein